ncbi:MAG: asparagine synthase (glutamine-hydrolyzing) [Pseudomonadota bacterium]
MCAINGIFAYHYAANDISRNELLKTRDAMANRGPDGDGAWFDVNGRIALGHRRLAIIDLTEAGEQPMHSRCGRYVITFNGEIYNYRELRKSLEAVGHAFRTQSDTEVLLTLFAYKGVDMVHDLRGMFAIAIWDKHDGKLYLVRDPFGVKPLYYADDGWTFRFASQVKALLAGGAVSRDPDPDGQVGFYLWGAVPEPHTPYREIRAVPAGAMIVIDEIGPRDCIHHFSVGRSIRDAELRCSAANVPDNEAQEELAAVVKEGVAHHLVSDVPVGIFLSAGVDSEAILGLVRDCGAQNIKTVTLRFSEFAGRDDDEGAIAAAVAHRYGATHTEYVVSRCEFERDLPRILDSMDQPSIDGINTWFAAKAARAQGLKVTISGLGGDELFGGYPSFVDVPGWVLQYGTIAHVPGLRHIAQSVASRCWRRLGLHPKTSGLATLSGKCSDAYILHRSLFLPWEISCLSAGTWSSACKRVFKEQRIRAHSLSSAPRTAFGKVAALEMSHYLKHQLLRDADWAAMEHGLEVRVPLVDRILLNRAMPLVLSSKPKARKTALAHAPSQPLPACVIERLKTGFLTPVNHWINEIDLGRVRGRTRVRNRSLESSLAPWPKLWARRWALFIAQQQMPAIH